VPARLRGRVLLAITLALLLSCSACQVTIDAHVEARHDGSGVIRVGVGLDREALAEVPDLAGQLEVDDLRAAGWRVLGPRREADGRTWVRASFAFATPADARGALARLNGPEGPFRDFALTRGGTMFRPRVRLTGTVDLSRGLEGLVDAALGRRLGAGNPGVDAATFERRFGADLRELLQVRVSARLPGVVRTWRPRVGGVPVHVDVSSAAWNPRALGLTAAGALALLVALVLLLRRPRPRHEERRRAHVV
jgi:hypothetical protein